MLLVIEFSSATVYTVVYIAARSPTPPPARPQLHAVASHFKQNNTFPMSLEDLKKFIFYFRFWDRVRRARRVPPLRATVRPISLCRSAASKHITPLQPIAIAAMVVRGDD